jgi:hypothetical protein
MCSLCGVLGGQSHWVDPASNPSAFGNRGATHTWHRERQEQSRLVNRILAHYRLSANSWTGNSFMVKAMTGQTELADNLSQVWSAAEKIRGAPCDPLDADLIAFLETERSR